MKKTIFTLFTFCAISIQAGELQTLTFDNPNEAMAVIHDIGRVTDESQITYQNGKVLIPPHLVEQAAFIRLFLFDKGRERLGKPEVPLNLNVKNWCHHYEPDISSFKKISFCTDDTITIEKGEKWTSFFLSPATLKNIHNAEAEHIVLEKEIEPIVTQNEGIKKLQEYYSKRIIIPKEVVYCTHQ